jgi:hypothetical protein
MESVTIWRSDEDRSMIKILFQSVTIWRSDRTMIKICYLVSLVLINLSGSCGLSQDNSKSWLRSKTWIGRTAWAEFNCFTRPMACGRSDGRPISYYVIIKTAKAQSNNTMICSAEVFHQIGSDIASHSQQGAKLLLPRVFVSFYGRTPEEVAELWHMCHTDISKTKIVHLFWCLLYMKMYLPLDVSQCSDK